jgi:hypothetical protein
MGTLAYCYLQHGNKEKAKELFYKTDLDFRTHPGNKVYTKEIGEEHAYSGDSDHLYWFYSIT